MIGDATVWQDIADGVVAQVGSMVGNFAPILVVLIGIAAFGLVVFIVKRVAS